MTAREISAWVAALGSAVGLGSGAVIQHQDAAMCEDAYESLMDTHKRVVLHLVGVEDEDQ